MSVVPKLPMSGVVTVQSVDNFGHADDAGWPEAFSATKSMCTVRSVLVSMDLPVDALTSVSIAWMWPISLIGSPAASNQSVTRPLSCPENVAVKAPQWMDGARARRWVVRPGS